MVDSRGFLLRANLILRQLYPNIMMYQRRRLRRQLPFALYIASAAPPPYRDGTVTGKQYFLQLQNQKNNASFNIDP